MITVQVTRSCRETTLLFYPKHPWKSGTYQLIAQSELEDLAGNNLRGPLDHFVGEKRKAAQIGVLTFEIHQKLTFSSCLKREQKCLTTHK